MGRRALKWLAVAALCAVGAGANAQNAPAVNPVLRAPLMVFYPTTSSLVVMRPQGPVIYFSTTAAFSVPLL